MLIKSLSLTNFRNFSSLSLDFDDKGNIFHGRNGIGKTNLLEAISYSAFGRSFRSLTDLDLIRFEEPCFQIKAVFYYHSKRFIFEAALDRKSRKLIRVNNTRLAKVSELYRYLKIVYFSQNDINLIDGAPKGRRQFFNMAISQSDFSYIHLLKQYYQLIKQRNALLKTDYSAVEKRAWDKKLIDLSEAIVMKRLNYLKRLNEELIKHYQRIGYDSEEVCIKPSYSFSCQNGTKIADALRDEIKRLERDEKRYQRTLIGPHLDDFLFLLNGSGINRFGSHGQKRCFAIAVKLALASLISSTDSEPAILIFDDVLADLDEKRAHSIIDSLGNQNQIFIATPTPKLYSSMKLSLFNMEEISKTP